MSMETLSDIVAEMRRGFDRSWHDIDREWAHGLADRIEAAAKREHEDVAEKASDDTPLVISCWTCAHYDRKRQYCPMQDTAVPCAFAHGTRLPVFSNGPCDRWECRYARKAR